jgi:hypothetical protein
MTQNFRVLLEEEAPFPDVSTKLLGMILEEEEEGDYLTSPSQHLRHIL